MVRCKGECTVITTPFLLPWVLPTVVFGADPPSSRPVKKFDFLSTSRKRTPPHSKWIQYLEQNENMHFNLHLTSKPEEKQNSVSLSFRVGINTFISMTLVIIDDKSRIRHAD